MDNVVEFINITNGFMGKHYEIKFKKWRKSQDFVIYPHEPNPKTISLQSDKRWIEINIETGQLDMTNGKNGHQNSFLLAMQKALKVSETAVLSSEHLEYIKNNL